MTYYWKTGLILPNSIEKTKEVLTEYYTDLFWDYEDIIEVIGNIKTWEDVKNFLNDFDEEELENDIAPYFKWYCERGITEEE